MHITTTGQRLYIPRTQEVLTNIPKKHILALGVGDIKGGKSVEETLNEISGEGGYAIIDHPFMCGAWTEEEILELWDRGLIVGIEWNGGLTFHELFDRIPGLKHRTPSKQSNIRALKV